ncbi:carbohydrate-binding domain-containing protein, partial [Streptococcus pyogenes]
DGSLAISEVSQYGIFASDDLVLESGNLTIDSGGFGLYAFHETEGEHGNLTINGGTTHISSSQEAGAAVLASNKLTINNG